MIRSLFNVFLVVSIWTAPSSVMAERSSITVRGRTSTTVTKRQIRLGDIALVEGKKTEDEESVIALKKIEVAKSPKPGAKKEIEAKDVITALQGNGVDINSFGYMFPRTMEVERAARTLTYHEVEQAVLDYIEKEKKDVSLKSLRYTENIKVSPGPVELQVRGSQRASTGNLSLSITAIANDASPVRFQATAQVDEWREVPVARFSIQPGQVVGSDDFKMARLNTKDIPKDAAVSTDSVIGFSATRMIGVGEVFKRNNLLVPAVVKAGSMVTLQYKSRLLEATAMGKALESGAKGDEIKVRNTASGNVVSATVIEPGLVGVAR